MSNKRNTFRNLCNKEGMDFMRDPIIRCYVIYDVQRPFAKALNFTEEWVDSLTPDELDLFVTELKLELLF